RVNGPWGLALASLIRERTGVDPQVTTGDDGILFRFSADLPLPAGESRGAGSDCGLRTADFAPVVDLVAKLTAAETRERLLAELPNSAVFGAQFRMNAARALLLPRQR